MFQRTAKVEGRTVKVGDHVGFKCDIEQGGQIVEIKECPFRRGAMVLVLENKYGFSGEYIGGQTRTEVDASDCWIG